MTHSHRSERGLDSDGDYGRAGVIRGHLDTLPGLSLLSQRVCTVHVVLVCVTVHRRGSPTAVIQTNSGAADESGREEALQTGFSVEVT